MSNFICPSCKVTVPDNWCGACQIHICRYCKGLGKIITSRQIKCTEAQRVAFLKKNLKTARLAFDESIRLADWNREYYKNKVVKTFIEKYRQEFSYSPFAVNGDLWWRLRRSYKDNFYKNNKKEK